MAKLLAVRIMDGARGYSQTVTQYPQYKTIIDATLIEYGRQDLIVEV